MYMVRWASANKSHQKSKKNMDDTPVKRCHSYNVKEIPVKFHNIHPSVNIQRDVVDGYKSLGR